MHNIYTKY